MQSEIQFVHTELQNFWQEFAEPAEKYLYPVFDARLKEVSRLLTGYKNRFEKLLELINDDPSDITHFREFNSSLLELLNKYQSEWTEIDFQNLFAGYLKLLQQEMLKLSPILIREELFGGYRISKGDHPMKMITKARINFGLFLSKRSRKIRNFFRKIRKQTLESHETYRQRKIPFTSMAEAYVGVRIVDELTKHLQYLLKQKSIVLYKLWKFDEEFDRKLQICISENRFHDIAALMSVADMTLFVDNLKDEITSLRKEMKQRVSTSIIENFEKLDAAMQIANTPDLPVAKFTAPKLQAQTEMVMHKLTIELKNWNNTQVALFDDWAVDVEIVLLYYSVLVYANNLEFTIDTFIKNQLSGNFDQLSNFIRKSGERLNINTTSTRKMGLALKAEREIINSGLIDEMLPGVIEKLSGSFTEDIEIFRNKTIEMTSRISDRRGFIKSKNYERAVRDSEINYISPRDLLSFEALPHFEKAIEEVKNLVSNSLEKVRLKLLAMGTVCDFSLESAGMLLQQKKNALKSAERVALEGYDRARSHIAEAVSLVETVRREPLNKLETAIHEFNSEIQELKNTENIFELNLRIARIRAIEQSRKMRRDIMQWVWNIIPEIYHHLRSLFEQANKMIDTVKSRMGIAVEKRQISFEVSEFIRRTETALQKLPFVYQRLYQIRPTDEERFFVNRTKEFELLEQAFNDWSSGHFVIAAVLGEKGCGITSFLSYFKRKNVTEFSVIHESPSQKIYEPLPYFNFFAQIFEVEKFESNDEIIRHINALHEKKVVILENLHHFFLKKVNGFECQKMLFELMSNTVKNIFWIGTYTTHSWDYLDKTIHVSDYFVREIKLEKLNSKNLREIIFKRNSLSGYKVRFEPSDELLESHSFAKLDDNGKQSFLDAQYFSDLTSLSNGNVSLAQLYWLHSTREVSDDTISVGAVYEIDLSFVKEIKSEYLFALFTLLVHDGLTLQDYAGLFNMTDAGCRNILVPMLEKGLLIKPNEKYNINPILFRQVVSYLRSRNFIS